MKNIVICCDGTTNRYESDAKNTNVVRLYERLGKDGEQQISYYDPGVGTQSARRTGVGRRAQNALASVFGYKVKRNVLEAYRYLMDSYEPGDRVFLFGYSRGAHTVRVLAGMLHKCGLLTKGSVNLIPDMARTYYAQGNDKRACGFKATFSRECKPYFIGVWDTVASVGWLWRRKFYRNTRLNCDVIHGYQALAIDERRWHFRPSRWDEGDIPAGQTIEQVWFPGCHSDVGGPTADHGLSDITLRWMLRHAKAKGLKLKDGWWTSLRPDPMGKIKRSDRHILRIGAGDRCVPADAKLHVSVIQRHERFGDHYCPGSLIKPYCKYNVVE